MPVKTPPEIIAKINADTNAALAHASVKSRFEDLGAIPRGTTPGQLAAFLKSEIDKWGPVIRDARIRVKTEGSRAVEALTQPAHAPLGMTGNAPK